MELSNQGGWLDCSDYLSPGGYVLSVVDSEGRYIYVNQGWINLKIDSQPLGRHYSNVLPNSKISEVIETGIPKYGYYSSGTPGSKGFFAAYIPIYENGVVQKIAIFSVPETNLQIQGQTARATLKTRYTMDSIIGESELCQELCRKIKKYAGAFAPVVIEGETGTGKELIAQALHSENGRGGPFVSVNCASIPESLFEAEFFGYVDGAFTGARKGGRAGLLEAAHNGTLFLDEIHHLSLTFQAKLLRALQERQITRVGGVEPIDINVRVICATNQSLEQLVREGAFRTDLYFRLNVLSIRSPALRERPEDIPLLAQNFIQQYSGIYGIFPPKLDDSALRVLMEYSWPGNIRELQNIIERAIVCHCDSTNVLLAEHFAECLCERNVSLQPIQAVVSAASISDQITITALRELFAAEERSMLVRALEEAGGNKTLAAQKLDISRTLLYNKLKEYNIKG